MRIRSMLAYGLVGLVTLLLFLGASSVQAEKGDLAGTTPDRWARAKVIVTSSSFYISKDGQWLNIVGEVENQGEEPVGWVRVLARYRDSEGRLVGSKIGYPLLRPIFPGQRAPFHLLDVAPSNVVTYTLKVSAYRTRAEPMPELPIQSHSWFTTASGIPVLVGELENPLDVPISRIRLPIALYDDAGRVVNVVQAQVLREVVPAHGRTPFVARIEEGPVGARVWAGRAQYRQASESSLPSGLTVGPVTPYIDASGYLILRGVVSNYGQERVNFVRVVGSLYDDAGTVLNASFSYPLTYHLDPGETDLFEVEFRHVPSNWSQYRVVVGNMP